MAKILVVDDDPIVRASIIRLLQGAGHDVVAAADGREGVALFRRTHPDLVITDIIMPEQEGIETIIDIRRERPDAKVIAMSGGGRFGHTEFLEIARKLGAADALAKPFEPEDFMSRVARCLARG